MRDIETSESSLTIRRTFGAPRERVFRAFTERDELEEWFAPSPGVVTTEVQTFAPEELAAGDNRTHRRSLPFG